MGMADMFKNLGALKEQMNQIKATVEKIQATGEAGGGLVKAVANGEGRLISLTLDPKVMSEKDRPMTEDLIIAAVNKAVEGARKAAEKEMKSLMAIPGMDKLFGQ